MIENSFLAFLAFFLFYFGNRAGYYALYWPCMAPLHDTHSRHFADAYVYAADWVLVWKLFLIFIQCF